jgi:hypothetical protein
MSLSMISNEALMTMQPPLHSDGRFTDGLGFIVPDITGPLGHLPELPVLDGFGDLKTGGAVAIAVVAAGVGIAAPLVGAYKGAKHSPGWAVGGVLIGSLVGGLVSTMLLAVAGATILPGSKGA